MLATIDIHLAMGHCAVLHVPSPAHRRMQASRIQNQTSYLSWTSPACTQRKHKFLSHRICCIFLRWIVKSDRASSCWKWKFFRVVNTRRLVGQCFTTILTCERSLSACFLRYMILERSETLLQIFLQIVGWHVAVVVCGSWNIEVNTTLLMHGQSSWTNWLQFQALWRWTTMMRWCI